MNHLVGRAEIVKFNELNPANHKAFEGGVAKWTRWLKTASDLSPGKVPNEKEVIYNDYFYDPAGKNTIFASSQDGDIEGLISMPNGSERTTYISYTGVAPWNLHTLLSRPKFTGLPKDLMRLSLLLDLHNAANVPENYNIFHRDYISDRGIMFAKSFFGISKTFEKDEDEIVRLSVTITKLGVKAFLEGDRKTFAINYSAVPTPLLI